MRKIMFNDFYGLTQAVLNGSKTMTRRAVVHPKHFRGHDDVVLEYHRRPGADFCFDCVVLDANDHELGQLPLPYEVGDVVAIAQSYKNAGIDPTEVVRTIDYGQNMFNPLFAMDSAGWNNKMFVSADLMPNRIRITDMWFERLQDISDEDCLREGVHPYRYDRAYWITGPARLTGGRLFGTPREAFSFLIDRISGKGTWEGNPWVVAYTFELEK